MTNDQCGVELGRTDQACRLAILKLRKGSRPSLNHLDLSKLPRTGSQDLEALQESRLRRRSQNRLHYLNQLPADAQQPAVSGPQARPGSTAINTRQHPPTKLRAVQKSQARSAATLSATTDVPTQEVAEAAQTLTGMKRSHAKVDDSLETLAEMKAINKAARPGHEAAPGTLVRQHKCDDTCAKDCHIKDGEPLRGERKSTDEQLEKLRKQREKIHRDREELNQRIAQFRRQYGSNPAFITFPVMSNEEEAHTSRSQEAEPEPAPAPSQTPPNPVQASESPSPASTDAKVSNLLN